MALVPGGGCWLAGSLLGRWTLGADTLPGIVTAGGGESKDITPRGCHPRRARMRRRKLLSAWCHLEGCCLPLPALGRLGDRAS